MKNPLSIRTPRVEDPLSKGGWTKRFLASGPRIEEATELYESMGLDVHLEPATAEDLACSECRPQRPLATIEGWYVIYTRPSEEKSNVRARKEELWRKLW
jgi:hypothetical protein